MGYLKYKGYTGSVEYSEDDHCLYGKVLGMSTHSILYEGQNIDELEADFRSGIDSYLDTCKEEGIEPSKPYSGSLNVRIPSEVHSKLAMLANKLGTSINAVIKTALTDFTKHAL